MGHCPVVAAAWVETEMLGKSTSFHVSQALATADVADGLRPAYTDPATVGGQHDRRLDCGRTVRGTDGRRVHGSAVCGPSGVQEGGRESVNDLRVLMGQLAVLRTEEEEIGSHAQRIDDALKSVRAQILDLMQSEGVKHMQASGLKAVVRETTRYTPTTEEAVKKELVARGIDVDQFVSVRFDSGKAAKTIGEDCAGVVVSVDRSLVVSGVAEVSKEA